MATPFASRKYVDTSVAGLFDGVEYDSTNKRIIFKHGSTQKAYVDATAFIKDGMVSTVAIVTVPDDEEPSGVADGDYIKVTFNTDAGSDPIYIPLTDIFNPANYYDKTAADGRFVQKEAGKGLFSGSYDDLTNKPMIPDAVSVDATLTQSGAAADAKATGDALAQKRGLGDLAVYAPSDFSEWTYTVSPALPEGAYISIVRGDQYGFSDSYWAAGVEYPDGGGPYPLGGDVASTSLTLTSHFDAFGPEYTVVFTRTVTAWTPVSPADTLAKTSQIPAVPSAVSAFTNDAGYITAAALPYPFVSATPTGTPAVLTITPRTVATFTATSTQASFSVAVGTGVTGAARDCVLVVDCTASGAVAPTVTWPSNFHPRTDAEEIAPVAGVRNVFYISEYAPGQFVVGGWHEEVA